LSVEDVEVVERFLVDFDALAAAEDEDLRTDAGLTVADAWGRNWTVGDVDNLPRRIFRRRQVDLVKAGVDWCPLYKKKKNDAFNKTV
jgi:hypothetical protein